MIAEPDCTIWVPGRVAGRARASPARSCCDGRERAVSLDPASLQVLISRLAGVAEEMGAVLRRAAFSPNIKERADCSAALFTADGELLVQAEHIPVHLGSMPASVRRRHRPLRPGPGRRGRPGRAGHPQRPVRRRHPPQRHHRRGAVLRRRRLGSVGLGRPTGPTTPTSAAPRPGSMPADATEIFAEGLRLPPVRLTAEVRALLLANSRTPDERAGDLDAQVGANAVGVERLAGARRRAARRGARLRRAAHAGRARRDLPDGTWRFADVIDSFGPAPDQQVATRDRGARSPSPATRSRSTSPAPTRSGPGNVNAVEAVTVSSVGLRPAGRRSTRRCRPTAARCGRSR